MPINMESRPVILECRGISKSFGGINAVQGMNLVVHHGELLGLIGPNGSGKSTLFNLITGMTRADTGRVLLKGDDISALSAYRRTKVGIARTFQNIRLFSSLSVLNNVLIGTHKDLDGTFWSSILWTRSARRRESEARRLAYELLEFVGLAGKENILGGNLPYGDQKRLELARALATGPSVLLLDEPMAGMNRSEAQQLMALLQRLNQEGLTIFIVEHNMEVIMSISERIIVINSGEKLIEGKPTEVQTDSRVIEVYLGKAATEVGA
ncbi:MAG: ABC transporter ATP-binding protein [Bacillota bacterium]